MTEYAIDIIHQRVTVHTCYGDLKFVHRDEATAPEAAALFEDCDETPAGFASRMFKLQYEGLGRATLAGKTLGPTRVEQTERPVGLREFVSWNGNHRRFDRCLELARRWRKSDEL